MPKADQSLLETGRSILDHAIAAVQPKRLFEQTVTLKGDELRIRDHRFKRSDFKNIYVIGFGKASAYMAQALEQKLGHHLTGGLVIVKYDHAAPCQRIKIHEAGHPVVDDNGLRATADMLEFLQATQPDDVVICLISGGGSALLEKPPDALALRALQDTFDRLLQSGANIDEMNIVRKHLSQVKGGQLLRAIAPARCLSLIISDVIGDHLETIASGPTAADPSTFSQALAVLRRYRLEHKVAAPVRDYLNRGANGQIAETVKPGDELLQRATNIILGNNMTALQAAQRKAQALGFNTLILTSELEGEAREAAKAMAAIVKEVARSNQPVARPACLLFGGETTVTVKGKGRGGRNQEFALATLIALQNLNAEFAVLCCGSDGTDGPTDAAGAYVSPEVCQAAAGAGLDPTAFLQDNDAYEFFTKTGALIKTGPTGTNVMDLGIALIN